MNYSHHSTSKSKLNRIYSSISLVISEWEKSLSTAALVGSASPVSCEPQKAYSDIDVIVLWERPVNTKNIVQFLKNQLQKIDRRFTIVEGWGVVSTQSMQAPVVHLHSAPVYAYSKHSSLYRRALAKYTSFVGYSLNRYSPYFRMTVEELLEDRLGPLALLDLLLNLSFKDTVWQCNKNRWFKEVVNHQVADTIDYVLYSVLHSIRNTLRLFDLYEEFSPLSSLRNQWSFAGGPKQDILNRIIMMKYKRRSGQSFSSYAIDHAYFDAIEILNSIITWIKSSKKVTLFSVSNQWQAEPKYGEEVIPRSGEIICL